MRGCQGYYRDISGQPCCSARSMQPDGGVRIEHFARALVRPPHCAGHLLSIDARAGEKPRSARPLRIGELHGLAGFEQLHLRRHGRTVAPARIVEQPLEVRGNLNVHRRRESRRHRARRIITAR